MTKSGFFIFVLILAVAFAFFLKLAYEIKNQGEGAPEQREANMEQYVEKGLE